MKFKPGDKIISTIDFSSYGIKKGDIFTVVSCDDYAVGFVNESPWHNGEYSKGYRDGTRTNFPIHCFELAYVKLFNDKLEKIINE